MDLMAAYPGRKFRMLELVNYIAGRHADHREKKQVRMGAYRVLQMLEESGHIDVEAQSGRGASALYAWRPSFRDTGEVLHEKVESAT
jgi:transcription initiation factor IIE alpha subunit